MAVGQDYWFHSIIDRMFNAGHPSLIRIINSLYTVRFATNAITTAPSVTIVFPCINLSSGISYFCSYVSFGGRSYVFRARYFSSFDKQWSYSSNIEKQFGKRSHIFYMQLIQGEVIEVFGLELEVHSINIDGNTVLQHSFWISEINFCWALWLNSFTDLVTAVRPGRLYFVLTLSLAGIICPI